jgi:hypothetical protein
LYSERFSRLDPCVSATLVHPKAALRRHDDAACEAAPTLNERSEFSALHLLRDQKFDRFLIYGPQYDITSYCFF